MEKLLPAIVIFFLFFGGAIAIDQLLKKLVVRFGGNSSEIFRIISNSQKAIMVFVGAVLALDKLGFDVSALVAGLGLTGFALGMALKDAISNLVAGVLTVLYKTVNLHDMIEISGVHGEVVDINLRYVTVKSGEKLHLIPNSLFINNKITIANEKSE